MGETVTSDTEPRVKKRRCNEDPQTDSSCTAKSVADVIVSDDSDNSEAVLAFGLLKSPAGLGDGVPGLVFLESMDIDTSSFDYTENDSCWDVQDDAKNIRECAQFRVRFKVFWSSIACVH